MNRNLIVQRQLVEPRVAQDFFLMSCIIFMGSVLAPESFASPMPNVPIAQLAEQSDLIVAGTVADANQTSIPNGVSGENLVVVNLTLSCDLILKGQASQKQIRIQNQWNDTPTKPVPTIAWSEKLAKAGDVIVAFLRETHDGFAFVEPWRPYHRLSPTSVRTVSGQATLDALLLQSLDAADPRVVCDSIKVLSELHNEQLLSRLPALATSQDPTVCGTAIAHCVKAGKAEYLGKVIEYFKKAGPTSKEAKIEMLCWIGQLKDKNCLPLLLDTAFRQGFLAKEDGTPQDPSELMILRREAVSAIRNIGSEQAVPYLIAGLHDKEEAVRFRCIGALNAIVGRPVDDRGPIRYRPEEYSDILNFWKRWWRSQDSDRYKTAR
jgi:hypothetical protein